MGRELTDFVKLGNAYLESQILPDQSAANLGT
jgi:hypothetical protein